MSLYLIPLSNGKRREVIERISMCLGVPIKNFTEKKNQIPIIYGFQEQNYQVLHFLIKAGRPYIYIDNGYGVGFEKVYRVCVNSMYYNLPKNPSLILKNSQNGDVLLLPPSSASSCFYGAHEWLDIQIANLSRQSKKLILIRQKLLDRQAYIEHGNYLKLKNSDFFQTIKNKLNIKPRKIVHLGLNRYLRQNFDLSEDIALSSVAIIFNSSCMFDCLRSGLPFMLSESHPWSKIFPINLDSLAKGIYNFPKNPMNIIDEISFQNATINNLPLKINEISKDLVY
jgi:hypothetical protein